MYIFQLFQLQRTGSQDQLTTGKKFNWENRDQRHHTLYSDSWMPVATDHSCSKSALQHASMMATVILCIQTVDFSEGKATNLTIYQRMVSCIVLKQNNLCEKLTEYILLYNCQHSFQF